VAVRVSMGMSMVGMGVGAYRYEVFFSESRVDSRQCRNDVASALL
jgi:hypothetical protein